MACYHIRKRLESISDDTWRYTCRGCGETWTEPKRKTFEVPAYMGTAKCHDPNDLTGQGIHVRHERRKGPSSLAERQHAERVKALRETAPKSRGRGGARLAASMPVELYQGMMKVDKHYWDDPKNLERHKEFLVDP